MSGISLTLSGVAACISPDVVPAGVVPDGKCVHVIKAYRIAIRCLTFDFGINTYKHTHTYQIIKIKHHSARANGMFSQYCIFYFVQYLIGVSGVICL